MTPLAHSIMKELTLPVKRRTWDDRSNILRRLVDFHCFEVTEAVPVAVELLGKLFNLGEKERRTMPGPEGAEYGGYYVDDQTYDAGAPGFEHLLSKTGFLPFPRTWLEMVDADGERSSLFLEENARETNAVNVYACTARGGHFLCRIKLNADSDIAIPSDMSIDVQNYARGSSVLIKALLVIINSPRIVGRRQHFPHRGLERDLIKKHVIFGKFPLHAWTEIKLEIMNVPKDLRDDPSVETHYTGQRAFHFVRAHLRIRNGQLEFVTSHSRGNIAYGIKQQRYRMVNA